MMDETSSPCDVGKRKQEGLSPPVGKRSASQMAVLAERKETLRQLKLVKFYREKHNLSDLELLIDQWTVTCQQALDQLLERLSRADGDVTMSKLLRALNIEPSLVRYDEDAEDFLPVD